MNLSKHFTLDEMTTTSRTAANDPNEQQIIALTALCANVLEPIRNHFGKPVTILSGFRSEEVNRLVGGAKTSQHLRGEAADITMKGVANVDVYNFIKTNLDFDQVIAEKLKENNGQCGWIHVSYRLKRNRKEALSFLGAGRYEKGLWYV
jgi:hypothetical protein